MNFLGGLQYNISYALAGLALDLVIFFYVRGRNMVTGTDNAFKDVVISTMGCCAADALSAITLALGGIIPDWINVLIFSSVFVFSCSMSAYFAVYLLEHVVNRSSKPVPIFYRRFIGIVNLLFLICLIMNFFNGMIFTIDGNIYTKQSLYLIVVVVPYFFGFFIVYFLYKYSEAFPKEHRRAIISFFLAFGGGAVLQFALFPNVLLVDFTASVALLPVLFTMETPDYIALTQTLRELEEARQKADMANKAKSEFLASMSHEIRTPINAVLGMNEMILRESDSSSIRYYSNNIKNSGNLLLTIINDILDISKIESGRQEIVNKEYTLSGLIKDCMMQVADRAETKGLHLALDLDETLPEKLYGDGSHIRQIIVNLLTNSVKYTERGYIIFGIHGRVDGDTVHLVFTVKDTGRGIRENELSHVFEKFTRADIKNNITIEGTGLGLSLVKNMTELMGGTVETKSIFGVGSVFTVKLSQKILDVSPIGAMDLQIHSNDAAYSNKLNGKGRSILVVDDVEINVKIVCLLLKECNLDIDTASSGTEAIKKTAAKKYDVVLMDHMMPGMDGIEAMKAIKADKDNKSSESVFIVLTANAIDGMKEHFLEEGFSAFLSKPVNGALLEETIAKYIG